VVMNETYASRLFVLFPLGFANGELHLYGDAPVHYIFHVPSPIGDVTHIQIAPAVRRLICLGELSNLLMLLN